MEMFYFSDPRCNFPKGRIQVQTEFPFYEPGNLVNGKIFIEVFEQLFANMVEIEIKGQEKAAFTRFYTVQEGDPPQTVERSERVKCHHKFAHYKQPVFQIPGGFLAPGTYAISFQFQLPVGMPSSIYFKDTHVRERPKAKIKYHVKTTIHCANHKENMKYKQVLVIREPPVEFKMNEAQMEESKISTWCCIDQGVSKMWANYEKNIYTPNEVAKAMIHVDNSQCTLAVTQVKFFVEQRCTIKTGGFGNHQHTYVKKLAY